MKKMIALFLALAAILGCTACGQREEAPAVEPDVTEMRAICELSVMDCYYHNVAKYFEEDAQKGFLGIGKKDKHFWIEYGWALMRLWETLRWRIRWSPLQCRKQRC